MRLHQCIKLAICKVFTEHHNKRQSDNADQFYKLK